MAHIFNLVPADDSPPIWKESDDLEALKVEAYKLIEQHQGGFARFIINGKACKVSEPLQVYFIENPEQGKPPIPLNPPGAPTFAEDGKTAFLAPRPPAG